MNFNMNRKTLQKVIDELKKDSPSLPYALGILETIIDSLPQEAVTNPIYSTGLANPPKSIHSIPVNTTENGEVDILQAETKAKMANIDLSSIKTE